MQAPANAAQEAARAPSPAKARSLAPKEHGAYGQLFVPMAAALLSTRPTLSSLGLAIAITAVFFAHEPLLLLLGHRGARAKAQAGEQARRRLVTLGIVAALFGVTALWSAPPLVIGAAAGSALLGVAVGWLVHRRLEKTMVGEHIAAAALASTAVPIGLAAGFSVAEAFTEWGVWILLFSAATLSVHAVIARTRREPWRLTEGASLAVGFVPLAAGIGLAVTSHVSAALALAFVPGALLVLTLAWLRPHARALRTLGWGTMAACVFTLLVLVLGVR